MATPGKIEVQAISTSTKIAEFWKDSPSLWFCHFEAIITSQKLGDESKFHLALTKLAKEEIQQVRDIILSPPEEQKYNTLKARLINCYEESEEKKFQRLFTDLEIGDQKPSQLLRKIKELGGNQINEATTRLVWLRQLPPSVTSILAVCKDETMEQLAQTADRIYENSSKQHIAAVSKVDDPVTQLAAEFAEMRADIATLKFSNSRQNNRQRFYRRTSYSQRRSPSPFRRNSNLCFYHTTYGSKARKCEKPCSWKLQGN